MPVTRVGHGQAALLELAAQNRPRAACPGPQGSGFRGAGLRGPHVKQLVLLRWVQEVHMSSSGSELRSMQCTDQQQKTSSDIRSLKPTQTCYIRIHLLKGFSAIHMFIKE